MCNHIATPSSEQLHEIAPDLQVPEIFEQYHINAFTHADIPVQTSQNPDSITMARWGLIPYFIRDVADMKFSTVNAKSETIHTAKSFQRYIGTYRALLWVNGVYEYQHRQIEGKKTPLKVPHFIYRPDFEPFTLGCVYSVWNNKVTVSIITTEANELFKEIHNTKERMPVIIESDERDKWLGELDKEELDKMMTPYPDDILIAHTISRDLATPNVDSNVPSIQDRVEYE